MMRIVEINISREKIPPRDGNNDIPHKPQNAASTGFAKSGSSSVVSRKEDTRMLFLFFDISASAFRLSADFVISSTPRFVNESDYPIILATAKLTKRYCNTGHNIHFDHNNTADHKIHRQRSISYRAKNLYNPQIAEVIL